MSWRRRNDGLLARVNFPPYSLEMLTSRHVLVGGGGGSSRTGVANGFEIFELSHDGTQFVAEEVTRYETGPNVVMNTATHNDGKRMWLVAGQESHCQLYSIQAKVVTVENGEVPRRASTGFPIREEIRHRRNSVRKEDVPKRRDGIEEIKNEPKSKHKKLNLVIKPSDSIQTDFGSMQPVQRVVRINRNGKIMATGGTDGHIRLWKFPEMTKLHDLEGHDKEIDDIDFSPRNKLVATVAKDARLLVWSVDSGTKLKDLTWNRADGEKSVYKRCRFRRAVDDSPRDSPQQIFTISNSLPSRERKKAHYGFLQLWNVDTGSVERLVTYNENLSELAVSDDGKFVAVGTMSSGTVDLYVGFSLQKLLHVPNAHNMFITNLEFLPMTHLDGPVITSNAETAVISCSVDNKICIHSVPLRHALPVWLFLIFIVLSISFAFIVCSYLGI